jgi:hypothetical protein
MVEVSHRLIIDGLDIVCTQKEWELTGVIGKVCVKKLELRLGWSIAEIVGAGLCETTGY